MSGPDPDLSTAGAAASGRSGVAVLEQALWRDLTGVTDDARFAAAWLGLTSRMVSGSIGGILLLLGTSPEAPPSVTVTPPGTPADAGLLGAARAAIEAGRGVVQPAPSTGPNPPTRIAYPILLDGAAIGAVVLDVAPAPAADQRARDPRQAMRQLQWAAAWLRERRRTADGAALRQTAQRTTLVLEIDWHPRWSKPASVPPAASP